MSSRSHSIRLAGALGVTALLISATTAAQGERMTLMSPDFDNGQPIPAQYSCDGRGNSPELDWANAPAGTQSLVLIARDLDAPKGPLVHWIVYDIPASTMTLPSAAVSHGPFASGAQQGTNGRGAVGWMPPCPPSGTHRYRFELFALGARLPERAQPTEAAVMADMRGHVLASAFLIGTYQRTR